MTHDQKILKKLYFLLLLVSLLQKESSFAEMTIFAKFLHAMRSNQRHYLLQIVLWCLLALKNHAKYARKSMKEQIKNIPLNFHLVKIHIPLKIVHSTVWKNNGFALLLLWS